MSQVNVKVKHLEVVTGSGGMAPRDDTAGPALAPAGSAWCYVRLAKPRVPKPKIELQLSSKPIPSTVKAKDFEMMQFLSSLSSIFCVSHLLLSCLSQGAVPAACAAQLPRAGLQPRDGLCWAGRRDRQEEQSRGDQTQTHPEMLSVHICL